MLFIGCLVIIIISSLLILTVIFMFRILLLRNINDHNLVTKSISDSTYCFDLTVFLTFL